MIMLGKAKSGHFSTSCKRGMYKGLFLAKLQVFVNSYNWI